MRCDNKINTFKKMKKYRFDIEISDSKEISGGYLYTSEMRTKKQIAADLEKLGKETLRNNKQMSSITYSAWEADTDDFENCANVYVSVTKMPRGFRVYADLD